MRRLTSTLTTGAAALTALVTLTGCGSSGPTDDLGLPAADDIASVEKFINTYSHCEELKVLGAKDDDPGAGKYFAKVANDPAFAVKERAACEDAESDTITILTISDMTKFMTANSAMEQKKAGESDEFLVGENFAVVPVDDDTVRALMTGGKLLYFTCQPKHQAEIPSGYTRQEPVKGCVLTNYVPS